MNPNSDVKKYEEIQDHAKMKRTVEEFLDDYNQVCYFMCAMGTV